MDGIERITQRIAQDTDQEIAEITARARARAEEILAETRAGAILDKVATAASALLAGTGMLTVAEETRPMAGGVVLRDGKVETNCSFEMLLRLQREPMAAEVARVLFDEA